MRADETISKVTIFMVGVGVGALVAALFTPKSGRETRRLIVRKAEDGRDYVKAKGKELADQAEEIMDRTKDMVARQKERLADAF
jgi:gas vesicle protein